MGLARAGWHLLSGVALFLVCLALILHDLSNANRPHELKLVPLVAVLSLVNVAWCARTMILLARAWRARHTTPPRVLQYLLFPVGIVYACVSAILVFAAVLTLFERFG
ncbi:MAG: hypothetical protein GY711_13605 [bacterium]|nr:hypothetical protein [bacterium]